MGFAIDLGFETWLDKLFAAAQSQARRVVGSEGLTLLAGGKAPAASHAVAHAPKYTPGDVAPHVCFDVQQVAQMVATNWAQYQWTQALSLSFSTASKSIHSVSMDAPGGHE